MGGTLMKNQELEVKLELEESQFKELLMLLSDNDTNFFTEQVDMYFCPQMSDFKEYMKTKCLRIRKEKQGVSLDYKEIVESEEKYAQHLIEHSTKLSDIQQMVFILERLGFQLILEIIKERYEFVYENTYNIALDRVKNLGYFIEIEIVGNELSYNEAGKCLKKIIQKLGLSKNVVNKEGYSNMMFNKKFGGK